MEISVFNFVLWRCECINVYLIEVNLLLNVRILYVVVGSLAQSLMESDCRAQENSKFQKIRSFASWGRQ